jgi:hypothetical protein
MGKKKKKERTNNMQAAWGKTKLPSLDLNRWDADQSFFI